METNNKIFEQMKQEIVRRGLAYKTEKSYLQWVKRFALFHKNESLKNMDRPEVQEYLNYLANERNVSSSTQNQALSALVFLFRDVLSIDISDMDNLVRAKKKTNLPTVLSRVEVRSILSSMRGLPKRITWLIYGTGMRITEALRLRINDIDFGNNQIYIRNAKGAKDRTVMLPEVTRKMLKNQIERARRQHNDDLAIGEGKANLPNALHKKYPYAVEEFGWQFLFPSANLSTDPRTGKTHRHHVSSSMVNKAIKKAKWRCKIDKKVSAHTFRHSFATHLLEGTADKKGCDIRTLQQLLGHSNIKTTMIYTHVTNTQQSTSPADMLMQDVA